MPERYGAMKRRDDEVQENKGLGGSRLLEDMEDGGYHKPRHSISQGIACGLRGTTGTRDQEGGHRNKRPQGGTGTRDEEHRGAWHKPHPTSNMHHPHEPSAAHSPPIHNHTNKM